MRQVLQPRRGHELCPVNVSEHQSDPLPASSTAAAIRRPAWLWRSSTVLLMGLCWQADRMHAVLSAMPHSGQVPAADPASQAVAAAGNAAPR